MGEGLPVWGISETQAGGNVSRYFHIFMALGVWWALDKHLKSDSDEDGDDSQREEGTQR